jgi:hypothetical protein
MWGIGPDRTSASPRGEVSHAPETPTELDGRPWAHVGPAMAALGHSFRLRTTDEVLGRYLEDVFGGLVVEGSGGAGTVYSLVTDAPAPWEYALYVDGRRIVESHDPAYVFDYLLWDINHQAVERTSDRLLLHAAGVERDGVGAIFAAGMECGKTTLAAGLVQRGYRYLTDEAVSIEPDTLLAYPFAKALSIDPGSWTVLADLEPYIEPTLRPFMRQQWQVPVTRIHPDALAGPLVPQILVVPRYERGASTVIRPVRRAEMLQSLIGLTFDFRAQSRRNLAVLKELVAGSSCFHLTVGDLDAACDLIDEVFESAASTVVGKA